MFSEYTSPRTSRESVIRWHAEQENKKGSGEEGQTSQAGVKRITGNKRHAKKGLTDCDKQLLEQMMRNVIPGLRLFCDQESNGIRLSFRSDCLLQLDSGVRLFLAHFPLSRPSLCAQVFHFLICSKIDAGVNGDGECVLAAATAKPSSRG